MAASFAMVFVRHGTGVCLSRQPEDSPIAPGQWTAIPIERTDGTPPESIDRLDIDAVGSIEVELVRTGGARSVESAAGSITITPMLVEVTEPGFEPTDGPDHEWVDPPSILERETPPWLWRAYESVAPTVRTVTADTAHGSTYLSIRALEVLRDRAATLVMNGADASDELAALAKELRSVRSDMVALTVRVGRAIDRGSAPPVVLDRTRAAIEEALIADREAALVAARAVGDVDTIFVFSRSGTVLEAIEHIDPRRVVTTVATPGEEGIEVAEALADRFEVVLAPDAAVGSLLDDEVDVVLLGADGVDDEGRVTNKLGSLTIAAVAAQLDVLCYVVTATAKLCAAGAVPRERVPSGSLYAGEASIDVRVDRFDRTPSTLIAGYCTESGVLSLERVRAIAEANAAFR
ncbi:MAG: initiation factor 2B [Halobacteriota archaeon]